MIRKSLKETLSILILSGLCAAFIAWSCATGNSIRTVDLRTLSQNVDISELTPVEAKRLETVMNREASPCGDDATLAESLLNSAHCPLAQGAGRYVLDQIKEDYSEEEISKSYLMRYGMVKGLDIPLDASPIRGAAKPLITIVIFTDFQCPFCAKAAEVMDELYRGHAEEYAFAFKNFPLTSIHPQSEIAARAAMAAHMQNKFWEMHDLLFSTVGTELTRERIDTMAEGINLDMDKFAADFSSTAVTAAIDNDRKLGESLGIHATPSIFINGRPVESGIGGVPERIREEMLRASLRKP